MKDQKFLVTLVIISLLLSITSTVMCVLSMRRNMRQDQLLQSISVLYIDQSIAEDQPLSEDTTYAQVPEPAQDLLIAEVQTPQPAQGQEQVQHKEPSNHHKATSHPTRHNPVDIITDDSFVDLGLPSGTLWKAQNEEGLMNYDNAKKKYKRSLPTIKQWEELKRFCQWTWVGNGYQVIGPSGRGIMIPAEGYRNYSGQLGKVGAYGNYWSYTIKDKKEAWRFGFEEKKFSIAAHSRAYGRSIRLVQKQSIISDIADAAEE